MRYWTVGELARATGVTVRTLHHYETVGLLTPARRTAANYRQYSAAEVRRLQQILSLRAIGLSLEEVGESLKRPEASALDAIERQLARLRERVEGTERLIRRLETLAERLRTSEAAVAPEEFIETMEMMTMFEKYYTPEQLEQLKGRREEVGEARIREVEAEWPRLMEEVRREMDAGTDPTDPRVQALARRWKALVEEFTGGDPGISASLGRMYAAEDQVHGMDVAPMRDMMAFIQRARSS